MTIDIHREDGRGNVLRTVYPCRVTWAGKSFTIPRGFESDGASVPRFFWRLVCPPLDHRAVRAGVAHDYIYRTHPAGWTKKEADQMFYDLLVSDGVPRFRAYLAYLGVELFGGAAWEAGGK